ncbi:MAG: helix-turn-helix domain-containing protein [Verrucomicrobiota bacterium]
MKTNTQTEIDQQWVGVAGAAKYFGVSRGLIKRWRTQGLIPSVSTSPRLIRFNLRDVEEALRRMTPKA